MHPKAITLLGLCVLAFLTACTGTQPSGIRTMESATATPSIVVQPTPTSPGPTPSLAPTVIATTSIPAVVEQARADLAGRLRQPISGVTVRAVERKTWNDRCMELVQPTTDCEPVVVEGYRLILAVGDDEFEYRTDWDSHLVLVSKPFLQKYYLVWLQVRRDNAAAGTCDAWHVFQDGLVAWEAPCQNRSASFYLPTEHVEKLRDVVMHNTSFTEQDDDLSVNAWLYGLGVESPRSSARTTVRDLMRWLLKPAGEDPPDTCTHTDRDYAYAVDYPCNWEAQAQDEPAALFLYSPGRGAPYAPPFSKVEIHVIVGKGGTPVPLDLADLEQMVLGADTVERQELSLNDLSAVRVIKKSELGKSLVYLAVARGHAYVLYGYGDLAAAEEVMKTFRPVD